MVHRVTVAVRVSVVEVFKPSIPQALPFFLDEVPDLADLLAGNPPLRSWRTGSSQNFASESSRST
jgi:hypothetical protein